MRSVYLVTSLYPTSRKYHIHNSQIISTLRWWRFRLVEKSNFLFQLEDGHRLPKYQGRQIFCDRNVFIENL